MIVGAPMNLNSGCILDVVLPSVFGHVIYVVLVSCLIGSGPAALNECHVDVIPLLRYCYVKVVLLVCPHMSNLVRIFIPLKVWR